MVIATDKKVASVLVDTEEYQKIQNITPTTGNPDNSKWHGDQFFNQCTSCFILLQVLSMLEWALISAS